MAWTDPPTKTQLNRLRRLADLKGQSFTYPATRAAASKEIDRLDRAEFFTSAERAVDRQQIVRDDHLLLSAARVRDDEIEGLRLKRPLARRRLLSAASPGPPGRPSWPPSALDSRRLGAVLGGPPRLRLASL